MRPLPLIDDCNDTCHSCWPAAGRTQARVNSPDWPVIVPPILSRNVQSARSYRYVQPCFVTQ